MKRSTQIRFHQLKTLAWKAYAERKGLDPRNQGKLNAWYRRTLMDILGVYSSKEIKRTHEFESACQHFANVSGDEKQIEYWSRCSERRALWKLRKTAKDQGMKWEYVESIKNQMGYDNDFDDLPADMILKINAALLIHGRRQTTTEQAQEPLPF